jgi:hypothetical protein
MPGIDYGTSSYFLYIAIMVALTVFLDLLLRKRSDRTKSMVLFVLLLSAFLLHFLKIVMVERYQTGLPQSWRYASLENICAVSVVVFPWIFLSKSTTLKDYMVIVGTLSGLAAFLIPTEGLGKEPFEAGVIRFYYSHFIIFVVPFLMARWKIHRISLRRVFVLPFLVYGVMLLVLANEFVLNAIGIVDGSFELYRTAEFRNSAFVFGIPEILSDFKPYVYALTPKVFLSDPVTGAAVHWPIIWAVVPLYIYGIVLASVTCFVFEPSASRLELRTLFQQPVPVPAESREHI